MGRVIVGLPSRGHAHRVRAGALWWLLACTAGAPLGAPAAGADADQGRRVYDTRCYHCHGYAGDGRTVAAGLLSPSPRDFTRSDLRALSRQRMLDAVRDGRRGTAMAPFAEVLSAAEIEAVVDFIRSELMGTRRANTRYHTAENGWPDHQRFAAAFPFALGTLPLDAPAGSLSAAQRDGRRLFLSTCIGCHLGPKAAAEERAWAPEAVSYPRAGFRPGAARPVPDALSGATSFARHDRPRPVAGLSAEERHGERLYRANCAFCHAADGSGRNWIGSFLDSHPRDLGDPVAMAGMDLARLRAVIRSGLPGTSMPAWGQVLSADETAAIAAYVQRVLLPSAVSESPLAAP